MIYNFKFKNILVNIDTEKCEISLIEPPFTNITTVYRCGDFSRHRNQKQISVQVYQYTTENGIPTKYSRILQPRVYDNNTKTIENIGYYDFFNSLLVNNKSIGEIADLAILNNQLENMTDVFGEKLACFNPYDNWSFFNPIECELVITHETILENDGTITINILNAISGYTYEYSIDNGVTYQSTNVFTDLSPNNYQLIIKCVDENIYKYVECVIFENVND